MTILFFVMAFTGYVMVMLGLYGIVSEREQHLRPLVLACGSRKRAVRLVDYEQEHDPSISRLKAIDRALARLVDDRERL